MNELSLAETEESDLSLADMEEMQCLMWLSFLRETEQGDFVESPVGGPTVFELNRQGAANLVFGRTDTDGLFLGVAPAVGTWFPHLNWKGATITNGAIRLQLVIEGNDMELVVPLLPMVYNVLPRDIAKLELSALEFPSGPGNDADTYERVSTREVVCQHKGGN